MMYDKECLLDWDMEEQKESIIKVIGVGGGGSNAINHMLRQGIEGVEFVICNTDVQALRTSPVKNRIQIGKTLTEGLGAGSLPELGRESAEESKEYIKSVLERNTKMIFITAGMGGGTGTGAAPVIAKLAKELGILTIAIVTIPFPFEGKRRVQQAMVGVDELAEHVDALLIICNEKLRDMYGDLKISKAFEMADNVLTIAAKSIAEIITLRGYVNVDFADVEVVMRNSGVALMGAGEARGENRALDAVKEALSSPLLNSNDIRGTSNILLNLLYGQNEVTMDEISLITKYLKKLVGYEVNVIWGAGVDERLGDALRVAVIATGFNEVPLDQRQTPVKFKVEEIEDLEMKVEDARKMEEEERKRREAFRQRKRDDERRMEERERRKEQERGAAEQQRRERRQQTLFDEEPEVDYAEEGSREVVWENPLEPIKTKLGKNELPDVEGWFYKKLGGMFAEDSKRDTEM